MMAHHGLAKLIEECGEAQQVAGKLLAYPTGPHPDGGPPLLERLRDEVADVLAAARFVCETHGFSDAEIEARFTMKLERFRRWHADKEVSHD